MSNSGERAKFIIVIATILVFFWTTTISLMICLIHGEEPPSPMPTCPGAMIHEEKCYCPATLVHCRPLPPPPIDISTADQTSPHHAPASSARNAIIGLALIISILGMLVQITALSGWWKPWGERAVWKKGRSRWGLTVRPAEGDGPESTSTEDEKMPLLVSFTQRT